MTLQGIKDKFKAPALAATLGAATLGAFSGATQAEGEQCEPLYHHPSGDTYTASTSAHIYSKRHVGAVGISIFQGADLSRESSHTLGTKLVGVMKRSGLEAECFVHDKSVKGGTSVNFHIAGLAFDEDNGLNVREAVDRENLKAVVAEARTARDHLASADPELALNN